MLVCPCTKFQVNGCEIGYESSLEGELMEKESNIIVPLMVVEQCISKAPKHHHKDGLGAKYFVLLFVE